MNRLAISLPLILAALAPAMAGRLTNAAATVTLDPAAGFAITEISSHGVNRIAEPPADKPFDRSPWRLTLHKPDGGAITLSTADATHVLEASAAESLTVTWLGVGAKQGCDLTVKVTIRLAADGASRWRIGVAGAAPGVLWQADFPRLALRPMGEDFLAFPQYLGRLGRDPCRHPGRWGATYPSTLSMQFMAAWGTPDRREPQAEPVAHSLMESGWMMDRHDAQGLLWATADRDFYYKRIGADSQTVPGVLQASIEHIPAVPAWPLPRQDSFKVAYDLPYDVVVQPFTGDVFTACKLYRGLQLAGPSQKPPGTTDPAYSTPDWFREIGFWAKFYHEPAKVVPEWAAYAKWLRVPIASHYYRGTIAVFDDNYPEMLPVDPYYVAGVRDAKDMGVRPLPYTNAVIWDQDTQSYLKEHGDAGAIKDECGNIPIWDIHNEFYAYMCPGAQQWQKEVGDTAYRQVVEHGLSGVYLDCLTATASLPCYDATHGHSLRGGNYYAQGQRRMMLDMRSQIRRLDPGACFFPEECGEWLIDLMDGYLTLDISRSYPRPGEQVFPLFDLVYHQDTINFGDDVTLAYDPARFAWETGNMLIWGAQALHSPPIAPLPREGDPNSEMLREVVQAYYVAGMPFLCGGEAVPMSVSPTTSAGPANMAVALTCAPYRVSYEIRKGTTRTWDGPAVLASAWRRGGDIGLVLCNISDQPQDAQLTLKPEAVGLKADAKLVRTWPREPQVLGAAAGAHRLTVPGRKIVFLVMTSDPAKASQGRKLLDTPWELLTADGKPFEPLAAEPGTLWACGDGPVANACSAMATAATPMTWNEQGELVVRQGVRPKLPEGVALPRQTAHKPFALLRPLPVTVRGQGEIIVDSGDERHLSCRVTGGVLLAFAEPGLIVVADGQGRVVRRVSAAMANEMTLPQGGPYSVGYARLEDIGAYLRVLQQPDLNPLDGSGSTSPSSFVPPVQAALKAFTQKPSEATLAKLSVALADLVANCDDVPGALVPETPLMRLQQQVQSLVAAQVGAVPVLQSQHDWLAPGLPAAARYFTDGLTRPQQPEARAVGRGLGAHVKITPTGPGMADLELLCDNLEHVERLVPLVTTTRVTSDGQDYALSAVLLLDANRPFELQGQDLPATAVSGRPTTADIVLRNWSPYDLNVWLKAEAPEGWGVTLPEKPTATPALKNTPLRVDLTVPVTARGTNTIKLRAGYTDRPDEEGSLALLKVNVQPLLEPLLTSADAWPQPTDAELAHLRKTAKLVLYASAGEKISVTLSNVRVTQYTNSLRYRLLDPDLRPLKQGSIAVDKSETIELAAATAGAYFLELVPDSGSVTLTTAVRPVALMATKADPVNLYCSTITRYFYVPAGAKTFRLGAQDGGPDETARFIITSPTGRIAFDRDGYYGGGEMAVEVKPDEAGKVWKLQILPRQDVTFWLAGDALPYLSTAPERVIVETGVR